MSLSLKERKCRYRLRHPDRIKAAALVQREKDLRTKYGITIDEYRRMYTDQEGRCAACRDARPPHYIPGATRSSGLAIDHDHKTTAVRGLLCKACNNALGLLQDDLGRIEGLFAYLWRNQKENRTNV